MIIMTARTLTSTLLNAMKSGRTTKKTQHLNLYQKKYRNHPPWSLKEERLKVCKRRQKHVAAVYSSPRYHHHFFSAGVHA